MSLVRGVGRRMGADVLVLVATFAGAAVTGAGPLAGQATSEAREALIERALESRVKGSPAAGVVVFEVADFQCPHCARFAGTVGKELDRQYVRSGKVQWVFVNLPLHNHRLAWVAAKAALCAGAVGGSFWAMHDRIFAEQRRWTAMDHPGPFLARLATEVGAPSDEYQACMAEDRVAPLILEDFGSAVSAGISGTPTFLIMKGDQVVERLVGVHPIEEWNRVLDAALRP
jgi:protein-disulfide isomerase